MAKSTVKGLFFKSFVDLGLYFNRYKKPEAKRPEVTCRLSKEEITREMQHNRHVGYHYRGLGV